MHEGVHFDKAFKDATAVFAADADAGITHVEAQVALVDGSATDVNSALRGKLNGVVDEIEEYLPEAVRVARELVVAALGVAD